jgi:hypothetical protein
VTVAATRWATAEEIAWAEAQGIDLRVELQAERSAGIRIAATLIDRARRRRLRAIDRAAARRGDWLSELHASGLRAAERTQQELREHRVGTARASGSTGWVPVCSCGWVGPPVDSRWAADRAAREELARMFGALSEAAGHTDGVAERAGLAS